MMASPINNLVRELRMSVARAKRVKDKTGRFGATTVTVTLPAHVALVVANRLELSEDRLKMEARQNGQMREVTAFADEALKDNALRFQYAISDLELLLMEFIGRPPMTMQEVREQRSIYESRPSPGPQPFIRKKPQVRASDELMKSIRERRIGNPREPGEDG